MTRLEPLKQEKEEIMRMHCLSFGLKDKCVEWYDHEIECIEKWGAENREVEDERS